MLNNIIAIIAISFVTVGVIWAIGNFTHPAKVSTTNHIKGILLVAQDNLFNRTNPDIIGTVNVPEKLVVLNKDFVRHDLIVEKLNINTAYLSPEQDFTTAIASKTSGIFEYYCSLHPITMRGKIVIKTP
ncbi:MAG: cupredoxin domain-containing protein [Thermoproteota archaeon]|nr:cupredoxin domain-containing protein [Thermoproteota archaeon]